MGGATKGGVGGATKGGVRGATKGRVGGATKGGVGAAAKSGVLGGGGVLVVPGRGGELGGLSLMGFFAGTVHTSCIAAAAPPAQEDEQ